MTRSITSAMIAAIAAQRSTFVFLLELVSSSGTVRLTTAPVDISWDGQTYAGIGGVLDIGGSEESADLTGGGGLNLALSGVDQAMISVVLNSQTRGRPVRIWMAHLNDDGTIVADPLEYFRGFQLTDYTVRERRSPNIAGTVDVTTCISPRMASMSQAMAVRSNLISHNDMLKRAGLATGDTFMQNVAGVNLRNLYWGSNAPKVGGGGYDDGRRETS